MKFILLVLSLAVAQAAPGRPEILPPGHAPRPPGAHALVGATVFVKPGEVLTNATVLIRDGLIEAAGVKVNVPADFRRWEMQGTVIYAGFIDAHLTPKPKLTGTAPPEFGDGETAGTSPNFFGAPGSERDAGNTGADYGIKAVKPEHRVAEGYSPDAKELKVVQALGFTAGNMVPVTGILRGSSAFVLLSDRAPNEVILKPDVFQHVSFEETGWNENVYPHSLMGTITVVRQAFMDAEYFTAAREHYAQTRDARHRPSSNHSLEALASAVENRLPVLFEPNSVLMADRAARVAAELKVRPYMIASGQEWRRPDMIGEIDAPFIVPLAFPEAPKLPDNDDWQMITLDQLRAWDWAPENPAVLRRLEKEIALTTYGLLERKNFRKNLRLAVDRGLSEADALAALTTVPARLCGVESMLGTIEPGKLANLTVVENGSYFEPTNKVREVWVAGAVHRVEPGSKREQARADQELQPPAEISERQKEEKARAHEKEKEKRAARITRLAKSPMENRGAFAEPKVILVKNAMVWTSGPQGIVPNADLLIEGGRISKVQSGIAAPEGAWVIDAEGKHVSPGLVDCHSHSFALGGVNEGTLPSTAMVRVGDIVNSETRRISDELAGGLTIANLLHGSANPIGGQNAVLKLRAGLSPEQMKMEGAPAGIKFALGENVKRARANDATRFPGTRMGVPTFMRNRFTAAQQYLKERERAAQGGGAPVRRDLELEAIGEILRGERLVHCHSYRQDEIVAFLRAMEDFKVRVGTLQHVLEGYKVADEIARHGAGASAFSDWWAFKFEVYDAIPYAGALMHERGVVVSFNSDSGDLARRLYLEAAKAVKYGGVPEGEALKFVTLNPARQLGIDKRVGSLEPGKDADFVIWSGSPLDSRTICLETWIDGKKYFDRKLAAERIALLGQEREALLAKAKRVAGLSKDEPGNGSPAKIAFFTPPLELRYENEYRHCDSH